VPAEGKYTRCVPPESRSNMIRQIMVPGRHGYSENTNGMGGRSLGTVAP